MFCLYIRGSIFVLFSYMPFVWIICNVIKITCIWTCRLALQITHASHTYIAYSRTSANPGLVADRMRCALHASQTARAFRMGTCSRTDPDGPVVCSTKTARTRRALVNNPETHSDADAKIRACACITYPRARARVCVCACSPACVPCLALLLRVCIVYARMRTPLVIPRRVGSQTADKCANARARTSAHKQDELYNNVILLSARARSRPLIVVCVEHAAEQRRRVHRSLTLCQHMRPRDRGSFNW